MFPALNPLEIRQTKAREVFLLFKRAEEMNRTLNKNKGKTIKPREEVEDVTGKTGGIYDWY